MASAKRILLAEDEEADVILMQIALQDFALENECAVVQDGQEVLDYLYCRGAYADRTPGNPELMLLDLKLPKVSGLQALHEIRADTQFSSVSVVVFSSSLDENDKAEALAGGANDFMIKPMNFEEFRTIIKKVISTYLDD
jgi:DNA-binding response OmpR family regulator